MIRFLRSVRAFWALVYYMHRPRRLSRHGRSVRGAWNRKPAPAVDIKRVWG